MAKFLISREPAFELFKVQSIQVDLLRVYKVSYTRSTTKSHRGDETITYRHNCQCILSLSLYHIPWKLKTTIHIMEERDISSPDGEIFF